MTSPLDGHSGDGKSLDAPDGYIAVMEYTCDKNVPLENVLAFIQGELKGQVLRVIKGEGCETIFFAPDCDASVINADTNLAFKDNITLLQMQDGDNNGDGIPDGTRYDLRDGTMLYNALASQCGKYPGAKVGVLGYKLEPTDIDHSKMSIRVEAGIDGQKVARIHIWEGSAKVTTIEGVELLELFKGQQAVLDANGNIVGVYETGDGRDAATGTIQEAGCSANPLIPNAGGVIDILPFMAPLILLKARAVMGNRR